MHYKSGRSFDAPFIKKQGEHKIFNYSDYLKKLQEGQKGLNPFLDFMGVDLLQLGEGYARFKMPVRPEYLQGAGSMQGGLIVALADEAIAHAMMTLLKPDEGLTTIELKSNFLSGVRRGDLIAAATVFKKGRSLILGDCLVTDNTEKNICRVSATFLLLKE
jgi:uncharacterized protein (TIGR00369 family)